MATEVLCVYLADDETPLDALKDAIEEHDSPELLRVQPHDFRQEAGMWVRDNLVNSNELAQAKAEGRYYRDDKSTFQWIWSRDETVDLLIEMWDMLRAAHPWLEWAKDRGAVNAGVIANSKRVLALNQSFCAPWWSKPTEAARQAKGAKAGLEQSRKEAGHG